MLTLEMIESLLNKLNTKLKDNETRGELCVVGGAAMMMHFNRRDSTKDIDALFQPSSVMRTFIEEISEEEDISDDWLNDGVKGYLTDNFEQSVFLELSNLVVYIPSPEYLLAMKVLSARVDSMDTRDLKTLISYLNIQTRVEIFDIVEKYYPKTRIQPKSMYFIDELLSNVKNSS